MATQRKSTDEQLEALRRKQEALKAKLDTLAARKKAEDRRRETRRAFVVGAAALERAEADPVFRGALRNALQASAMRAGDKAMIADLLGLQPEPAPSEAAPQTEAA